MKSLTQYIYEFYQPLNENGASGHMMHPFDVNDFTVGDISDLISQVFGGQIEGMTEKLDGFGIQASMNDDGEVVFIRNKGQLNSKRGGITLDDFAEKWSDNPTALENYTKGGKIIEAVFKKIGPKFFNPNPTTRLVANCECILAGVTNTIPYASDQVDFHNIWVYEHNGTEWIAKEVTKRGLNVIEKACEGLDNAKITPNVIIKYNDTCKALEQKWLKNWEDFLKTHNCPSEATMESIKTGLFYEWARDNQPWILDDSKEAGILCRRWIFKEKRDWKNTKAIYQDHVDELEKLDKDGKLAGDILLPLQMFFYKLGADVIKVTDGFVNSGNDNTVKSLLSDLKGATEKIRKEGSLDDNRFLDKWMDVLNEIGEENLSSAEGVVFSYKGNMMKFTGGFVPLNRIIGYSKYTM